MIASLVVLILILAIVFRQYIKAAIVPAFLLMISSIIAMTVALSYYGPLSQLALSKGYGGAWAAPGCLILLFIITTAVFSAIGNAFIKIPIDFSALIDKVISCLFAAVTGIIFTGILLIAVAMMPLAEKWPYARFDTQSPDITTPSNAMIPADSITAGLFSITSKGAFASNKNFAALNPDFVNQIHINKIGTTDGVLNIAGDKALKFSKTSIWRPDDYLKSAADNADYDKEIIIIKTGFTSGTVKDGGSMDEEGNLKFPMAQIRLLTTPKSQTDKKFTSSDTQAIHPIGYLNPAGQINVKRNLAEIISLSRSDFRKNEGFGNSVVIPFVFELDKNMVPLALAFRNNFIAELPKEVSPDQITETTSGFIQASNCKSDIASLLSASGIIKPTQLTSQDTLMEGLMVKLDVKNFDSYDTQDTSIPLDKDENAIYAATLELSLSDKDISSRPQTKAGTKGLSKQLHKIDGYNLVALKCNIATKSTIPASKFPTLVEIDGTEHHAVGILAGGKSTRGIIYQFDYCSLAENLTITNDVVSKPFPTEFWAAEKTDKLTEAFFLYLVKAPEKMTDQGRIITRIKLGSTQSVGFDNCEGFIIKKQLSTRRRR